MTTPVFYQVRISSKMKANTKHLTLTLLCSKQALVVSRNVCNLVLSV